MNKVFPNNQKVLSTSDGGLGGLEFKNKLVPDKGIYVMRPIRQAPTIPATATRPKIPGFGATGHWSLFDGSTCMSNKCYFGAGGGVYKIVLWKLN